MSEITDRLLLAAEGERGRLDMLSGFAKNIEALHDRAARWFSGTDTGFNGAHPICLALRDALTQVETEAKSAPMTPLPHFSTAALKIELKRRAQNGEDV